MARTRARMKRSSRPPSDTVSPVPHPCRDERLLAIRERPATRGDVWTGAYRGSLTGRDTVSCAAWTAGWATRSLPSPRPVTWGQHFPLMVNANKRHASISSVLPLVVAFQRELGQAGGAGSVASRLVREEIEMRGEAGSDD